MSLNPARVAREFAARYRLEANRCEACGQVSYPARIVCPACRGRKMAAAVLPTEGKVESYTVIHVPPSAFKLEAPYVLAIVELTGGVRLTCQVADVAVDDVKIGMPVRLEFRRIQEDGEAGVVAYGHKAVPA